jgi:predicted transcriptional regulator
VIEEERTMIAETTPKERMLQTIQDLPEDSSYEELIRELAFARMIERGLADSEAGRTISHEEMGRRIASWSE